MQRPSYTNPPPAHSPPLHHPVPQHVSTVPQLRSPPPPAPQSQPQQSYGYNGQQQQQQGGGPSNYMQPNAFGGFMNDPTAQMGFQVGKTAVMAGQEYMEQNFNRYVNFSALKHYFNVSNSYVINKLYIVLFPWRHKPWSRQQRLSHSVGGVSGQQGANTQDAFYLPPREDTNSPDMYIPVMGFVTYILLSTLLAGLGGKFNPELLGTAATWAFLVVIFEIAIIRLAIYFLSINNESQLLDLVAYSGYKFVGINVTLVLSEVWNRGGGTGGWFGYTVFIYTYLANALFLLRSLRYVLLPDSSPNTVSGVSYTSHKSQKQSRTYFLATYSYVAQLFFMWVLTRNI
ncbi:YIF1-domain-containing protein [Tothia fuscella]|uniref:Protein YIF1 n=1 Tax=Tothia fuscella TaxID=1048955 RepID=A0A9P4P165_9PEZI|nr:YIF1-domain-containing protein [Tothia fuscella]